MLFWVRGEGVARYSAFYKGHPKGARSRITLARSAKGGHGLREDDAVGAPECLTSLTASSSFNPGGADLGGAGVSGFFCHNVAARRKIRSFLTP